MFLYTIVVPVLPFALDARAGTKQEDTQHWVSILLAAYGAALFFGSIPASWIADRSSTRQPPFLVGCVAIAGGSLLLCLGTNLPTLIVGRILQGLAGAIVWVIGFAILADTFGSHDLGLATGFAVLGWTAATLIGPVLGGVVFGAAGYYPVFYMSFAVIALDVVLRLFMVEKRTAARWADRENESSNVAANPEPDSGLEKMIETSPTAPSPETLNDSRNHAPLEVFQHSNRQSADGAPPKRSRSPMLSLLRSPRLLAALWGVFVQAITFMAFDATLPLHVAAVFGWTSTGAGLIFLSLVVPSFLAPLVGKVLNATGGGRVAAAGGYALACPALALLRLVDVNVSIGGTPPGSVNQVVLLCALLAAVGLALTIVMVPILTEMTTVVDAREKAQPGVFGPRGAYARAYGLMNMGWALGAVVGPLVAGAIRQSAGWSTLTWVLALVNGVTVLPMLLLGVREHRQARPEEGASGTATASAA